MKLKFFLVFLLSINLIHPQNKLVNIKLVQPDEGEVLEINGKNFYLIGSVNCNLTSLQVNNTAAEIDKDGAFVAYAPLILFNKNGVQKGKFIFEMNCDGNSSIITKEYDIKYPHHRFSNTKLEFDTTWESTQTEDIKIQKGEYLNLEVRVTPNSLVSCSIENVDGEFQMTETKIINNYIWGDAVFGDGFCGINDTINGVYRCSILLNQPLNNSKITFTAKSLNNEKVVFTQKGKVSVIDLKTPIIVKTTFESNLITTRYAPYKGYALFLDGDILLQKTGEIGNYSKVKLSNDLNVFVPTSSLIEMPAGTPLPVSSIYAIRSEDDSTFTNIQFGFSERVPYKIIQNSEPQSLTITFYGVDSNIDWIRYDKKSEFIKEIKWTQPSTGVLVVTILLNQKTHWGYSPKYNGSTFILKINKPAKRNSSFLFWSNQLKGRNIVIDPGHNPESGAIGPRFIKEKDVNFAISLKLKKMLEDKGVIVHLTHNGEGIELRDRKERVNSLNPEICVSIHNNAVPQGVDVIKYNGSSVYYYYPQAKPLAEILYKEVLNEVGLRPYGLYWDNLYMCRIPETISLLVEPAFMSIPLQEKLLTTESFQEKIALAILDALETFYERYSE